LAQFSVLEYTGCHAPTPSRGRYSCVNLRHPVRGAIDPTP
jgi:hypothetical protein